MASTNDVKCDCNFESVNNRGSADPLTDKDMAGGWFQDNKIGGWQEEVRLAVAKGQDSRRSALSSREEQQSNNRCGSRTSRKGSGAREEQTQKRKISLAQSSGAQVLGSCLPWALFRISKASSLNSCHPRMTSRDSLSKSESVDVLAIIDPHQPESSQIGILFTAFLLCQDGYRVALLKYPNAKDEHASIRGQVRCRRES